MAKPKNKTNKKPGGNSKPNLNKNGIKRNCDNFIVPTKKVIAVLIVLLGLVLNFALNHPDPHYAVWLSCIIAELIIVETLLCSSATITKFYVLASISSIFLLFIAVIIPNKLIPDLKQPAFSEHVESMSFSLGERGMTVGYSKKELEKQHIDRGFVFNNYRPVDLYIEDGRLYADVKIYGGSGFPPIEIKKNKLSNKPPDWDFNSNETAMEIVNEKGIPIYQFFYKTPYHIVMNGIFPYPGGLILANENGAIGNPIFPTTFKLNKIFKYPSWRYPGEYKQ